jgi:hypothetical protein
MQGELERLVEGDDVVARELLADVRVEQFSDYDATAGLARFEQAVSRGGLPSGSTAVSSKLTIVAVVIAVATATIAAALLAGGDPPPQEAAVVPMPAPVDIPEPPVEAAPEPHAGTPVASEAAPRSPVADDPPPATRAAPKRAARSPKSSAPRRKAEPPDNRTAREIAATDRMRRALRGDPNLALQVAREGEREFGKDGLFHMERRAHEALALAALGRRDEARRKAAAFLTRWPRGPLSERVREIVDDDSEKD